MKTLLTLIVFLFLTNSSFAHKDRILKIDKRGNIIGLPKQFGPAKLDLDFTRLRINDKEIIFPKCLTSYFEKFKNAKVYLSASWYHSKKNLPYYLNIQIHGGGENDRFNLLVDLETLEIIHRRWSPIDLTEKCLIEYNNAIKTLK